MAARILYVIDKLVRAGAQGYLSRLALALNTEHFQPLICCLLQPGPLVEELRERGISVSSLGLSDIMGFRYIRAVHGVAGLVRREKVDLIHSYLFAANLVAPAAGLLSGRKVVTSRRDDGFWKQSRHVRALRLANLLTARITANSRTVADYLRERERTRPDKIVVIPNGIELPAPSSRSSGRKPVSLGCLGNIRPVKGYEYLLRAVARLRGDWNLTIAGRVLDEDYHRRLNRIAADLSLTSRVFFCGEVDRVDNFLSSLDILALPSLSEGFSNSVLEAMASGLPVVATRVGANPEVIRDGVDGYLVPPGEDTILAARLQDLIDAPALRGKMGAAARRRAGTEYSLARSVAAMENLYRELL